MLTIDQVVQASVVDRCGCPVCHQRRHVDLDCHCCGGLGYVDCDDVYKVLEETLFDCCLIGGRAPNWIAAGFYTVIGGAYVVLPNHTVDYVTDDQAALAYRVSIAAGRPGVFARLLSWVMPRMLRGVA